MSDVYVYLPSDYMVGYIGPNPPRGANPRFARGHTITEMPALPTVAEAQSRLGEPYTLTARTGDQRWRALITPGVLPGNYIMVARPLSEVDSAVGQLIWTDGLVSLVALLILAMAGTAIVRKSLRPLVEIERTAGAIANGDLTRRVPQPEPEMEAPRTELGRLARAFNMMLGQIETAFRARAASEYAAREAAAAALASETRARGSEQRMRQFAADASHELRTPLTTIRGFAELYRQGAVTSAADTATLIRRIEDEATRMGLLVEDLLLLARLDRERPIAQSPVDLRIIGVEAVQAARAVAPDRSIDLEIASGTGDLVVLGDDARLRQVVSNLVSNALTHTPTDAAVTVRLRAEDGPLGVEDGRLGVVEVADTGQGLTQVQAERIFERFYRVDAARTRRADGKVGTGLGLAIVAALVAAQQGDVQVESSPGTGTTFRVRLPLIQPTAIETDGDEVETDQAGADEIGAGRVGADGVESERVEPAAIEAAPVTAS